MVEAPCATPRCKMLATMRARDAERIDAVMLVEAAILDGDEGFRHVARQFLQRQHGAAGIAARGERAAVRYPRSGSTAAASGISSDWIGGICAPIQATTPTHADDEPQPEHQAPIDRAADQRTARATFAGLLGAFALGRRLAAAGRGAVARRDPQLGRRCQTPAPGACPIVPVSTPCATRPDQPALAGPQGHAKRRDLRGR